MFGNDRTAMRKVYLDAWTKKRRGEVMTPLETQIADIVGQHPEYHPLLEDPDRALDRDFLPEGGATNPFLHMGMHLALQEQITTDRPPGVARLYRRLVNQAGEIHQAEHRMMECLGQALWEAQRAGRMPDEASYLQCLERLLRD